MFLQPSIQKRTLLNYKPYTLVLCALMNPAHAARGLRGFLLQEVLHHLQRPAAGIILFTTVLHRHTFRLICDAVFVDQEMQENEDQHVDQIEHTHLQEGDGPALGVVEQATQKAGRGHACHH